MYFPHLESWLVLCSLVSFHRDSATQWMYAKCWALWELLLLGIDKACSVLNESIGLTVKRTKYLLAASTFPKDLDVVLSLYFSIL